MKAIKILMVFIFCFNVGCVPMQDTQMVILNNSNDTITFHFSELSYFDLKDSVIICNPYSENIFFDKTVSGTSRPCHPFIEEQIYLIITVKTSNDRILTKNIKKNSNWYCAENTNDFRKVVFEINDEDLE